MSGACRHRDDAGPWVLGALADDDAQAFAAHLEACPECRAQVADLQMVADVLPMAAPQVIPPPELKATIMAVVGSEARLLRAAAPEADRPPAAPAPARRRGAWRRRGRLGRLRPVPAAVAATVLLAVGVAGGVLLAGGDDTTAHPGFGPRGSHVALRVSGEHGELDLRGVPAPPAGRIYQVWLVTGRQRPRPTHTLFTVRADGRARVQITESLKGADRVLVTAEPSGGSRQPTSPPIAGASLT